MGLSREVFVAALAFSYAAAYVPHQRPNAINAALEARAAAVACPGSDGQTVISNGLSFIIECGIDHSGGDLSSLSVSSFQACIDACSANTACVDVSLSGSACYLKSTVGARVSNGVYGARKTSAASSTTVASTTATSTKATTTSTSSVKVTTSSAAAITTSTTSAKASTSTVAVASTSAKVTTSTTSAVASATSTAVSCPASDGLTVVSGGKSFIIECGIDHSAGDLSNQQVTSFQACIDACSANAACVDVSYTGSTCYLKSSVGARVTNSVFGARELISSSSSAAATSTSSTKVSTALSSTSTVKSTTAVTSSTLTSAVKTSTVSAVASSTTSAATSATGTPLANSGKRGLSYNQANLTLPFSLSGQNSLVSWAYNWFYQPCSSGTTFSGAACDFNSALDFIPILFSDSDLANWPARAERAIAGGAPALMSFNEPDFCISGSACMTVNASVAAYKSSMQPYAGRIPIGAPAVTNQGAPGGTTYMGNFIGNCTGCQIDFINVHWYSNVYAGATYFEQFINQARAVRDAYPATKGKPIWVTEFGLTNDGAGGYLYTDADTENFLQQTMTWMDQQADIARYAYFMDSAGILANSAGTGMSAVGAVYNSFTNTTTQPNLG